MLDNHRGARHGTQERDAGGEARRGGAVVVEEGRAGDADRAARRGEQLGLTEDEVRFYDALAANESAVRELTDETLKKIAHELTENLRKRILRKYKGKIVLVVADPAGLWEMKSPYLPQLLTHCLA